MRRREAVTWSATSAETGCSRASSAGVTGAINARGAQFVGFVHGMSQKFFASSADYREVMGITLNQSLLIFKFGARRPEDGMIITETGLMY